MGAIDVTIMVSPLPFGVHCFSDRAGQPDDGTTGGAAAAPGLVVSWSRGLVVGAVAFHCLSASAAVLTKTRIHRYVQTQRGSIAFRLQPRSRLPAREVCAVN